MLFYQSNRKQTLIERKTKDFPSKVVMTLESTNPEKPAPGGLGGNAWREELCVEHLTADGNFEVSVFLWPLQVLTLKLGFKTMKTVCFGRTLRAKCSPFIFNMMGHRTTWEGGAVATQTASKQ